MAKFPRWRCHLKPLAGTLLTLLVDACSASTGQSIVAAIFSSIVISADHRSQSCRNSADNRHIRALPRRIALIFGKDHNAVRRNHDRRRGWQGMSPWAAGENASSIARGPWVDPTLIHIAIEDLQP